MTLKQEYRKMEKILLEIFHKGNATKKQAIDEALSRFSLTSEEMRESNTNSKKNILKSRIGEVFFTLCQKDILVADASGVYRLAKNRPVIIHEEKCELAILAALKNGPKSRTALRALLTEQFGTDRTATDKDDAQLASAITVVLTRLSESGTVLKDGATYALCEQCAAEPTSAVELARLRAEYLTRVHSKGGEFFEHYFMNLLERYVTLHGKTVLENTTVGGAEDGGIDGILQTRDCLGFEERILVQTKNRRMTFSETDMRGFYGAVLAAKGSRGIYATTGSFHSGASRFLDALPELVGIDGYRLFEMATETLYGIKKSGGKLTVDTKIIG